MLLVDAKHPILAVIPVARVFCLGNAAAEVAFLRRFKAVADFLLMLRKLRF